MRLAASCRGSATGFDNARNSRFQACPTIGFRLMRSKALYVALTGNVDSDRLERNRKSVGKSSWTRRTGGFDLAGSGQERNVVVRHSVDGPACFKRCHRGPHCRQTKTLNPTIGRRVPLPRFERKPSNIKKHRNPNFGCRKPVESCKKGP